jgi:alpha-glucosidase
VAAHHDGSGRYVSDPAPALGDTVTVFVETPASVTHVDVRTVEDGEPRYAAAVVDRIAGRTAWWRASITVVNPLARYRFLLRSPSRTAWLNALGLFDHDVPDAHDFRLASYAPPPSWAADAVVYQIFPDRFARSSSASGRPLPDWAIPCDWSTPVVAEGPETPYQFFGGDLDGIVDKLGHIEGLGVNTVYLTPIFPARSNHRYDASTFDSVDPVLGGDAAFARLAAALRARGMRLIGDITPNHSGAGHEWFERGERDLYYFDDSGEYESWWGFKSLPKLNWHSAELRRRFFDGPTSVIQRWLSMMDGWRVDVANMTGRLRDDDLASEVGALLRRAAVEARPDALVIAEHVHDATGDLDRDGWHGTMNSAGFLRPVWSWLRDDELDLPQFLGMPGGVPRRDAAATMATMRSFAALVSWRSLVSSWPLLGSHDTPRVRTVVGSAERQEIALGLLMTYPGTPMVFAGDEFGLRGGPSGEAARTPMPWGSAAQGYYRALIELRRSVPELRHGGLRWEYAEGDTLVFRRDDVLVLARRAAGKPLPLSGYTEAENLYGGAEASLVDGVLTVPGDGPTFQVWRLLS